jgi:hypothetical protein
LTAILEILHITFVEQSYGYGDDLKDAYYLGLLDMLCDPDISDDDRYKLADSFWYRTPQKFKAIALNKIQSMKYPLDISSVPDDGIDETTSLSRDQLIDKLTRHLD